MKPDEKPSLICKPMVATHLNRMAGLQRVIESFRYILLTSEQWMSPDGKARSWVKANARFAVFMATPTLLAFPVVTVVLWALSSWVNALTSIASKLIFLPILVLLALISMCIVFKIISAFNR